MASLVSVPPMIDTAIIELEEEKKRKKRRNNAA
jgi:hypothetical protein